MLYSGTVAAAMEAAAMNYKAIAISAQNSKPATFEQAANFIANFLPYLDNFDLAQKGTARRLININVPSAEKYPKTKGVCLAKLGLRIYKDQFEKRHDPHGRDYYWLSGSAIEDGEDQDSDVNMLSEGYITVTPVFFNMTDLESLNSLKANLNLEKLNAILRSE
jgi:5'-nucleotidase